MRKRRTQSELEKLRQQICEIAAEIAPCTVRQLYYQLVAQGVIEKTEQAYKLTVRECTRLRLEGRLPWSHLADHTRWMHKPDLQNSLNEFLSQSQALYRRDLWKAQNIHVEVWIEKDALTGVFDHVTSEFGVGLFPCRGYPSIAFLHSAAVNLACKLRSGKPCHLYYFGDYDPSGVDIPRNVVERLRMFVPQSLVAMDFRAGTAIDLVREHLHFQSVAVTPEQITELNLPTRPTKRSDSRAKEWSGGCVELDAIHPTELRRMTAALITQHIDSEQWESSQQIENAERDILQQLIENLNPQKPDPPPSN